MRRGLNPKLGGGGLHHVAVEARDFEASLRFYTEGLRFVAATGRARRAGAEVVEPPTDVTLEGDPPVPGRHSFVRGPNGEAVEFIAVDAL